MNPILLRNQTPSGDTLEAIFLPDRGMNMISYKRANIEIIDQSTKNLFEERFAGLGALIGPHFHRRRPETISAIKDENLFPHIARVKAKGVTDPFSHGIARYAPWKILEVTPTAVSAILTGKDTWNGVPLSALEGQNFIMNFRAELTHNYLQINLTIVSDTDSLVGIHYYYHLPQGTGTIISRVQKAMIENTIRKPIPPEWNLDPQQTLKLPLKAAVDNTFFPFPNPLEGNILLDTGTYRLRTRYSSSSQENSWQLYHPEGASFVCIEPISAQDPRHPNLSVSALNIQLEILGQEDE